MITKFFRAYYLFLIIIVHAYAADTNLSVAKNISLNSYIIKREKSKNGEKIFYDLNKDGKIDQIFSYENGK